MAILTSASVAEAAGQAECQTSEPRYDALAEVAPRGELVMESGLRVVLSGVHWPDASETAGEATALLMRLKGEPLTLIARGSEDRWGRLRVDASPIDRPSLDLAGELVDSGYALVSSGESDALCRTDLLAREAAPRMAEAGVWAAGTGDARAGTAFAELAGRFVVAQGTIRHVGERERRTYLDFAPRGEIGLSVTVPKRTWRMMAERGLTKATLLGRHVRVRGRVEIWRGPILDIVSPDMIEPTNGEQAPRR